MDSADFVALSFLRGTLSASDVMVPRPQVMLLHEDAVGSELRPLVRTTRPLPRPTGPRGDWDGGGGAWWPVSKDRSRSSGPAWTVD